MSKLYYGPTRGARDALGPCYLRIVLGVNPLDHGPLPALPLAGGGAFDSEYPHFPQDRRSLCSARNVPGPHFGQDLWVRLSASPLTS
jgi:hypothetical protein